MYIYALYHSSHHAIALIIYIMRATPNKDNNDHSGKYNHYLLVMRVGVIWLVSASKFHGHIPDVQFRASSSYW